MIQHCFSQNRYGGAGETRLIFQKKPAVPLRKLQDEQSIAEFFMTDAEGSGGAPEWESGLDGLRAKVEPTKKASEKVQDLPHPVPQKAKEKLKQRLIKEIFDDKETQEYYVDRVREALETPGVGDRLHAYIVAHGTYKKASFRSWNAEFNRDVIQMTPEEKYVGKNEVHTNMRITAATQILLVEYYKTDVFQLTRKKINPWIFIDGKMGPYTVSVLAEYWKYKHGPKSKKPDPKRADIHPSYSEAEKRSYDDAQTHLNRELQGIPVPEETDEKEAVDPGDQIAAELKPKKGFNYAKLDQGPEDLDISLDQVALLTRCNLSDALLYAFGEGEAFRNTKKSSAAPKTFRVLHRLHQKIGDAVDEIEINAGDRVSIEADTLRILKRGTSQEYKDYPLA